MITEDTTLDSNVVNCPGDGIVIGADRITLNLDGHAVGGLQCDDPPTTCVHQDGIDNSAGHDGVVVENGAIVNFENGVLLRGAQRNQLIGLTLYARRNGVPGTGISLLRSDRNRILRSGVHAGAPAILLSGSSRNTITELYVNDASSIDIRDGIRLIDGSNENWLIDSYVFAEEQGLVIAESRRNVIERSYLDARVGNSLARVRGTVMVRNTFVADVAVALDLRGNRNLTDGNRVIPAISIFGARNVIRHNTVDSATGLRIIPDGIFVEAGSTKTVLKDNVASAAPDDGIDVEAPGTLIQRNVANSNGDFGIEAVEGVIDGGGNQAKGNGNPLQCLNVFCK